MNLLTSYSLQFGEGKFPKKRAEIAKENLAPKGNPG